MSSLVWTQADSGLVVGNYASDEARVRQSLREYDRDLRLVPPGIFIRGEHESRSDAWRVYRYLGSGRDVQFVCGWWDDYGNPYLQLSSDGLLRKVKQLDRNSRVHVERDSNAENKAMRDRIRREHRNELLEMAREFDPLITGKKQIAADRVRKRKK